MILIWILPRMTYSLHPEMAEIQVFSKMIWIEYAHGLLSSHHWLGFIGFLDCQFAHSLEKN
jgi:hypothetical protein